MNEDLKIIKKKYGENMSRYCREYFPSLLEQEGLLSRLLLENFEPSHELYQDIEENALEEEFKNYIYSLVDVENNNEIIVYKTPKELLDEAGYILYECHSESDIQSFKKYYTPQEELCTFKGNRLDRCYVFFAVKKDVDKIKREDYCNPKRQDLYGTSVISIQFARGRINTLSIKNRYNHKVNNPDATFSNNLDNIILGLSESFKKFYHLNFNQNENSFEIPNYVMVNGKYYKYNYEVNNIYYCPNNIIIDNFEVKRYAKERYIVLDYFILDLQEKTITLYDKKISDSFPDTFSEIKRIEIINDKDEKNIYITNQNNEEVIITLNKDNKIIKIASNMIQRIGDNFLCRNTVLEEFNAPNITTIGDNFLFRNTVLEEFNASNITTIGNKFLYFNSSLKKFNAPNITATGDNFLSSNTILKEFNAPNITSIGKGFLFSNTVLEEFNASNITTIGNKFLYFNSSLKEFNAPQLTTIGDYFLEHNTSLEKFNAPNLELVGSTNEYITYLIKSQREGLKR